MLLKKVDSKKLKDKVRDEEVSVLIEPLPRFSDQEIINALEKYGASHISVLAKGYISAQIKQAEIHKLEDVAHVHIKQMHHLRSSN